MRGVAFVWNLSVIPYGGCTTVTDDAQCQPHPRASAQGGVITHTTRIDLIYRECRLHER
jgi:hypothetical protein